MISFRVYVDASGLQDLRNEIQQRLANLVARSAQDLLAYEKAVFDTEGAINGECWLDISDITRKKREAHGVDPNNPILHARGMLRSAYNVDMDVSIPMPRCSLYFRDLYDVWDTGTVNLPEAHHFGRGFRYPMRPLFDSDVVEQRMVTLFSTL